VQEDAFTYTVTVSGVSGEGTLRLDLISDGSIQDATAQPLAVDFTSGEEYTITPGLGDVDLDGDVDLMDLMVVAGNYGQSPPADLRADVDGDGDCDLMDLMIVAGNYGNIY
jgi:hypothetical protein